MNKHEKYLLEVLAHTLMFILGYLIRISMGEGHIEFANEAVKQREVLDEALDKVM
jgi:hypothetical protein